LQAGTASATENRDPDFGKQRLTVFAIGESVCGRDKEGVIVSRLKRTAVVALVVATFVLVSALPAAASGYADCGGGGHGYTYGGGTGYRTHKFGGHEATPLSPATIYHGFFSGTKFWDVTGAGSENGWCVT
jgi:hypothetical protein